MQARHLSSGWSIGSFASAQARPNVRTRLLQAGCHWPGSRKCSRQDWMVPWSGEVCGAWTTLESWCAPACTMSRTVEVMTADAEQLA